MLSCDIFFVISLDKLWNHQSSCLWFGTPHVTSLQRDQCISHHYACIIKIDFKTPSFVFSYTVPFKFKIDTHTYIFFASMIFFYSVNEAKFAGQIFQDVIMSHTCFLFKFYKHIRDNGRVGWGKIIGIHFATMQALWIMMALVGLCHFLTFADGISLQWQHNGRGSVSNHQPHDCFLDRSFRHGSKKASKLRVTGLCAGNSPEAGEFPAQMTSNAENASIWWRHHVDSLPNKITTLQLSTLTAYKYKYLRWVKMIYYANTDNDYYQVTEITHSNFN